MKSANGSLRIGAGQTDITPKNGIVLGGATINGRITVNKIIDPLYAKTMFIESKNRKLCIVTLDLLMITKHYVDLIRNEIGHLFGLEQEAVMIHATQNHKSPSLGHFKISDDFQDIPPEFNWLRGG